MNLREFEEKEGGSRVEQLEKALERAIGKRRELEVDIPSKGNKIKFAVASDLHFGSNYEASDELEAFFKRVDIEGITTVLTPGDVLDGHRVYAGQEYDLHALGFSAQRNHFVERNKVIPGHMKMYFIAGNHDASLKKLAGVRVGEVLQEACPNWVYCGEDVADLTLKTKNGRQYKVRLIHPDGGTAYAISYKAQKYAESLEGGTKPNMVLMGHFHKAEHLPQYRNIDMVQAGTFQWQTPFLSRKGSAAHVGGWIIEVIVGSNKSMSNSVKAEFVSFYKR